MNNVKQQVDEGTRIFSEKPDSRTCALFWRTYEIQVVPQGASDF
jgi:hypothetical protein